MRTPAVGMVGEDCSRGDRRWSAHDRLPNLALQRAYFTMKSARRGGANSTTCQRAEWTTEPASSTMQAPPRNPPNSVNIGGSTMRDLLSLARRFKFTLAALAALSLAYS